MVSTKTAGGHRVTRGALGGDGSSLDRRNLSRAEPLGFAAGDTNLYRYVGNGPTDGSDPSGLIDSPYNKPIPGVKTPTEAPQFGGSYPKFTGKTTNHLLPNWPKDLKNTVFFIGPPLDSPADQRHVDPYNDKGPYLIAMGVPAKNIFYFSGSTSLKNATAAAKKLGLVKPGVYYWFHGGMGQGLLGNPNWPGYENPGPRKVERLDPTTYAGVSGLIASLGPGQTTLVACNFVGKVRKRPKAVEPDPTAGIPFLN